MTIKHVPPAKTVRVACVQDQRDVQVPGIKTLQKKMTHIRSSPFLAPTCIDGIQNGYEEGADCGGPCTLKYDGQACILDKECKKGYCGYYGTCQGE